MGCAFSRWKKDDTDGIRSHLVRERKGEYVEDSYETIALIAKGSVGMISRVRHRQTGVEYALKTIQLEKISSRLAKEMRNEIAILKRLDHPNIIRAIETFEADQRVYLVMKLCTGGNLRARCPYTEEAVARIITKLVAATWYTHSEGIVHRDLKLENVVYESEAWDSDIYIIDYGLSKITDTMKDTQMSRMKEMVGTLYTMAPEVLKGSVYDNSCDMWSLGVMTYVLLSGDMPFDCSTRQRLMKAVEDGSYDFSGKRWDGISNEARNFVRHMMVKEPSRRYTPEQALQHEWIRKFQAPGMQRTASSKRKALSKADHERIVASMKNFASYSKVKKTALMLVAYKSRPEETKAMRDAFKAYDIDQNGYVGREEFMGVLRNQGYQDEELVGLFDEVDDNHDGHLHYTEFLAATLETQGGKLAEERLAEAFDQIDMDDSGVISKDDLAEFLGRDCKGYDVTQLIAEADGDDSGVISLEQFTNHMRKSGRFCVPSEDSPSGQAVTERGAQALLSFEEEKQKDEDAANGLSALLSWTDRVRVSLERDARIKPPAPGRVHWTSDTYAAPPRAPPPRDRSNPGTYAPVRVDDGIDLHTPRGHVV